MVIAFAAMQVAVRADPGNTPGTLPGSLAFPSFLVANAAVFAAVLIVIYGVVIAVEQRRSRRQLPPRPGAGGRALEGERRGDTGDGPVPLVPAPARPTPTCGLTAHGRVGRILPGGMPGRRAAYGPCPVSQRCLSRRRSGALSARGWPEWPTIPQISHLIRARCSAGISRLAFGVWLLASLLITARAIAIHAGVFILLGAIQAWPRH